MSLLSALFPTLRRRRLIAAKASLQPRKIRIHSHTPGSGFTRVAFEFLDPPGPYSMQFYEAARGQDTLLAALAPGTEARYYETRDRATIRLIETSGGEILWPR